MKCYRSCFIVDVKVDEKQAKAVLTDSVRNRFFVDLTDNAIKSSFNSWLKTIFLNSKTQSPTVFEYVETEVNECEVCLNIINFKNAPIQGII